MEQQYTLALPESIQFTSSGAMIRGATAQEIAAGILLTGQISVATMFALGDMLVYAKDILGIEPEDIVGGSAKDPQYDRCYKAEMHARFFPLVWRNSLCPHFSWYTAIMDAHLPCDRPTRNNPKRCLLAPGVTCMLIGDSIELNRDAKEIKAVAMQLLGRSSSIPEPAPALKTESQEPEPDNSLPEKEEAGEPATKPAMDDQIVKEKPRPEFAQRVDGFLKAIAMDGLNSAEVELLRRNWLRIKNVAAQLGFE